MTELTRKVGFHAKSMEEFRRLAGLDGVNLIEVKPDFFRKRGNPIYTYSDGRFTINHENASQIRDIAGEKHIHTQVHLPFERVSDPSREEGLCQGVKEHHPIILDRYKMLAELLETYGIGEVITVHPPSVMLKGKIVAPMVDAVEYGRQLYFELDKMIKQRGFGYNIGIENLADPKYDHIDLGYEIEHLKGLLGQTEKIGLTVDTGHRLLAQRMHVAEMASLARIVNMHFHSNPGVFSHEGFDDDKHEFATIQNLSNFQRYIIAIRRHNIPVICEISDLDKIDDGHLKEYISDLRVRLS